MIRKKIFAYIFFGCLLINSNSFASSAGNKTEPSINKTVNENKELQTIIDNFSSYAASVTPELRQEIIAYRKEIALINQEKQKLYKRLSQEAQAYLSKEQGYKKSLAAIQNVSANDSALPKKKDDLVKK